jgi:hypothetical protein
VHNYSSLDAPFFISRGKEFSQLKRDQEFCYSVPDFLIHTNCNLAEFIGLFFFTLYYYLFLGDLLQGCTTYYFTGWLFPYILVGAIFVRVLRLLLIYNLNQSRLVDAKPTVSCRLRIVLTCHKFFTNPKLVSELYLFLMFGAVFSFFILYRIFSFTYESVYNHLPPAEACETPAPYVGLVGKTIHLAKMTF